MRKIVNLIVVLKFICGNAYAATISYVAQTGPGGSASIGVAWPNPRFTVDSSGQCMIDNLTGLMWPKDTGLFPPPAVTWDVAKTNVAKMNTDPSATGYNLCGYTDWRLPNVIELASLINYSSTQSSDSNNNNPRKWLTNTAGFTGGASGTTYNTYWTSTESNASVAYNVGFSLGSVTTVDKTVAQGVFPVRNGR